MKNVPYSLLLLAEAIINYWDDCHLELIPRPSSATEINFQRVFECENVWSGRADARNQIRKERF